MRASLPRAPRTRPRSSTTPVRRPRWPESRPTPCASRRTMADALGELQVASGDERLARRLERRLDAFSSMAARLGGRAVIRRSSRSRWGSSPRSAGYVDIGDLVFNAQAGALFGYQLLWAIPVGVLGHHGLRRDVRPRRGDREEGELRAGHASSYGPRLALATLVASLVLSFLTLAAELGGVGLVAERCSSTVPQQTFMLIGAVVLIAAASLVSVLRRDRADLRLRRAAAARLRRRRRAPRSRLGRRRRRLRARRRRARRCTGTSPSASSPRRFMPYEIYFYSSGARRGGLDREGPRRQPGQRDRRLRLGGIAGGRRHGRPPRRCFTPRASTPTRPRHGRARPRRSAFGETGLVLALLGHPVRASAARAIDTCFSAAYNLAQFKGWEWGKRKGRRGAPRWTVTWLGAARRRLRRRRDRHRSRSS